MNEKFGISQIHIIPFDVGYVFYDVLNINNVKNLLLAKEFVAALSKAYKDDEMISIEDNLMLDVSGNKNKKITKIRYKNCEIAEQAICIAKLSENVSCYILSNGIGVFVLLDCYGLSTKEYADDLDGYSKALIASFQKKLTQSTILSQYEGKNVFPLEEKLMLSFRVTCWSIISKVTARKKIKPARKFSSNQQYKTGGLSYVLTIYVFKNGEISDKEVNYLMYSPFPKKLQGKEVFDTIQKAIQESAYNNEVVVCSGQSKMHFSWSAVAAILPNEINCWGDIIDNPELNALIKSEIYVQSRWFIADNSMDNVNKSFNCKLEELQRIESFIEFVQAELDNEISANMNSLYKNVLQKVVETSSVKQLYRSVLNQIQTQKKIKAAHDQDIKKHNTLIINLFMAIFTASSLCKTVLDIISNNFSTTSIVIFFITLVLALGTILFDYYNN